MVNPQYLQEGFDACLDHLVEECAEVIQAASKIKRFGKQNRDPRDSNGLTNLAHLEYEMTDLIAAINRMKACIVEEL